ncbi:MAG TPA: response regulator [Candidatus Didemnitutus sp.]|nr:response regulator [Candidatus Didemnitutus sp.]
MIVQDPIVLLVEDSDNDGTLMRIVFERAGLVRPMQYVQDGDEAIAYLSGDGSYADRQRFPWPTVMLLDLNMPRKNGFEVLAWVRGQPVLKRLPIHVLSASSRPEDIRKSYDLGASSYLVKPGNLAELTHLARCLLAWIRISHFSPLDEADELPGIAVIRNHAGNGV